MNVSSVLRIGKCAMQQYGCDNIKIPKVIGKIRSNIKLWKLKPLQPDDVSFSGRLVCSITRRRGNMTSHMKLIAMISHGFVG